MVAKSADEIGALMRVGDDLVRRFALQVGRLPAMDHEDICQELRIHALVAARRFDPSQNVPWRSYLASILRLRIIDVQRARGTHDRSGRRRDQRHFSLDGVQYDHSDNRCDPLTPADHVDDAADVDWRDFVRQSEQESPQVQSIVLYCGGVTMREIGLRFGYSESWASDLLRASHPLRPDALTRLRVLAGIERRRKPQTAGRS